MSLVRESNLESDDGQHKSSQYVPNIPQMTTEIAEADMVTDRGLIKTEGNEHHHNNVAGSDAD